MPSHRKPEDFTAVLEDWIARERQGGRAVDPVDVLAQIGTAVWSPDFAALLEGKVGADVVRCGLCRRRPCTCPPIGTPEFLALLERSSGTKVNP